MHTSPIHPKEQRIEATITRADGRVERLGVISYTSRNPLKHLAVNAWIWCKARWRARRAGSR